MKKLYLFLFICLSVLLPSFSMTHAKGGYPPDLSYSLTSFHKGDLHGTCQDQVASAKNNGFTTITFVPTIEYHENQFRPDVTLLDGELVACLNRIWDSGMNIVYQPHLDNTLEWRNTRKKKANKSTKVKEVDDSTNNPWRADFRIDPGGERGKYYESMFKDFVGFIGKNKHSIGSRQIDVIIAAELEKSTTAFPVQWMRFAEILRAEFDKMGIRKKKIRIGFNPNWRPHSQPVGKNMKHFEDFVKGMDFIAPSFYGDLSPMTHPCSSWQDVRDIKAGVMKELGRGGPVNIPFAIGEFGTGPIFAESQRDQRKIDDEEPDSSISKQNSFISKRRKIYQNLLEWAANDTSVHYSPPYALNIWTVGIFDPIKSSPYGASMRDPDIENMFKQYTEKRGKEPICFLNIEGPWHHIKSSGVTDRLSDLFLSQRGGNIKAVSADKANPEDVFFDGEYVGDNIFNIEMKHRYHIEDPIIEMMMNDKFGRAKCTAKVTKEYSNVYDAIEIRCNSVSAFSLAENADGILTNIIPHEFQAYTLFFRRQCSRHYVDKFYKHLNKLGLTYYDPNE